MTLSKSISSYFFLFLGIVHGWHVEKTTLIKKFIRECLYRTSGRGLASQTEVVFIPFVSKISHSAKIGSKVFSLMNKKQHWFSCCRIFLRLVFCKAQIFIKRSRSSIPLNWLYLIFHHFWNSFKLLRTFFLCYSILLFGHDFLVCFSGGCSSAIFGRIIFLRNYTHAYIGIMYLGKADWPTLLGLYEKNLSRLDGVATKWSKILDRRASLSFI